MAGLVLLPLLALGCRHREAPAANRPAERAAAAVAEAPAPRPPEPLAAAEREPAARSLAAVPPERLDEYRAQRPKSVVELQPFRAAATARAEDAAGRAGEATLTDLNPAIHRWLLLELAWEDGRGDLQAHLENRAGRAQRVRLDPGFPHGVVLEGAGRRYDCDLWSAGAGGALAAAAAERTAWVALCGGRLFLRNPVAGRKTTLEWATDFLRDRVWGGERVTVFVREKFYKDAYLETGELLAADREAAARRRPPNAPLRPRIDPAAEAAYLVPSELGLVLETEAAGRLLVGRWYPVRGLEGVFASAIRPELVHPDVIADLRGVLNPLDEVESSSLVYVVAFDLDRFEPGFAMGTDHPRVGWSERTPPAVRDDRLPGPDGIGSLRPLIATGMLHPRDRERVVATFTGGFKRSHGAFKSGELATTRFAHHYGFVEHGTILSKLQPGLATAVVFDDGRFELGTWSEERDAELGSVRHARQNGVPLVETDAETGEPRPGELVPRWALGNWSGSVDQRLRALRAGLCLQESDEGRFLLYGYFSSVTPSAMARVFVAYRCRYAMLTDMNALEHTYLALYRVENGHFRTQHLIDGMSVLDRSEGGQELPRFVGFPDNRDFFYLLRREER